MHCISHPAYHAMFCIMLLAHCTVIDVVPLLVFLLRVEPGDEFVNEDPVEYVSEEQAFVPSKENSGKMIITHDIISIIAC